MSFSYFLAPVFIASMGTAHVHRLEGAQNTVTIEGQTVVLSLHTSPDALTALYGRRALSDTELHQVFLAARSARCHRRANDGQSVAINECNLADPCCRATPSMGANGVGADVW